MFSPLRAAACVLLVASGCGGDQAANVTGAVLVDGELASRGTVTFYPVREGALATGRIREDGSFSLRVGKGNPSNVDASMIPVGDYRVTVVVNGPTTPNEIEGGPPVPGPRLMATRYGSVETTDLVAAVKPGENLVNFDLDSAELTESEEGVAEEADTTAETEATGTSSAEEAESPTQSQDADLGGKG